MQATTTTTTPTDRLAADLYALVVHLHKECNADLFQAMGEHDLTMTQTKLLHKLERADRELTLKHAAELLGLSLPAASRAVDDLVRRGLLERHEDEADRRMKRIRLTEPGATMIRRVNAARLNGLQQFAVGLSDEERTSLVAALELLLARPEVASCRPDGATDR